MTPEPGHEYLSPRDHLYRVVRTPDGLSLARVDAHGRTRSGSRHSRPLSSLHGQARWTQVEPGSRSGSDPGRRYKPVRDPEPGELWDHPSYGVHVVKFCPTDGLYFLRRTPKSYDVHFVKFCTRRRDGNLAAWVHRPYLPSTAADYEGIKSL